MFSKSVDITCDDIISVENLLEAWGEFLRGKRKRKDVQEFQYHLMDNILALHSELKNKTYTHGPYEHFVVTDPKRRDIHKASVRDRLVYHAIHRKLYPFFDKKFIHDSYSCRAGKGTHKAMNRFRDFARVVSKNNTRTAWVLKCDIRKFFASIDHARLFQILEQSIFDAEVLWLLRQVVKSFHTEPGKGLPLGNLTSQLLMNVYMNEFDQWVKRTLKARYYIRYADDFVFLSWRRAELVEILPDIYQFLIDSLSLSLHPHKVSITTLASGVDFLGWVHFLTHLTLRTVTKRRLLLNVQGLEPGSSTVQSYLGMLSHGNSHSLQTLIRNKP